MLSNRRSEQRRPSQFLLEVSGFDRRGRFFTERTACLDVGEISCAFRLRSEVAENAPVAIRVAGQNSEEIDFKPQLFQVVRVEEQTKGWMIGAIMMLGELAQPN